MRFAGDHSGARSFTYARVSSCSAADAIKYSPPILFFDIHMFASFSLFNRYMRSIL
jgi:hypothetical protein